MSWPLLAVALVGIGYLIGAVPVGVLVGRAVAGVDLRQHGSRRTGATNALRTLGTGWAAAVFALDVAKGVAAVALARLLFVGGPGDAADWVAAAAGLAAVVGHNWSVFIGFGGGRGVATSAGGLLVLTPLTLAIVAPLAALATWRTRYVSLGSIMAGVAAPIATAALAAAGMAPLAAVAYSLAVGALVVISHADNMSRLRAGTERRLGDKEVVTHGRGG
jgi:acyl phosphate:glycerol-3-phosphate acyltransferase